MNTDADSARLQANQDAAYALVKDRVLKLARQHGRDVAIAAMQRFGVERAYLMDPAHYSQFLIAANEILLGATWVPVEDKPARVETLETLGQLLRSKLKPTSQFPAAPVAPERIRPALTWAESKPVDRFDGFVIFSSSDEDDAEPPQGPLQILSDTSTPAVNPAHAMAAVLGRVGG